MAGANTRPNKRKRAERGRRGEERGERERRNESFVFAHISRNILCLSLLPLVYPVSVRPAYTCVCPSIFVSPFSSGYRSLRVPTVAVVVIVVVVFVDAVLLLFATNCTHLFIRASLSLLTSPSIYSKWCLRSR